MARCSRCNKIMLFSTKSGYCSSCIAYVVNKEKEALRIAAEEKERVRKENEALRKAEEAAEKERIRQENEARRKAEEDQRRKAAEDELMRKEAEARHKEWQEERRILEHMINVEHADENRVYSARRHAKEVYTRYIESIKNGQRPDRQTEMLVKAYDPLFLEREKQEMSEALYRLYTKR